MLPADGSSEWESMQREAISIATEALKQEQGNIPNALYKVYMAFRERFLEERGLMDTAPGGHASSVEALEDARLLEFYVCQQWASIILAASSQDLVRAPGRSGRANTM